MIICVLNWCELKIILWESSENVLKEKWKRINVKNFKIMNSEKVLTGS